MAKANFLDRAIEYVAPGVAARRMSARMGLETLPAISNIYGGSTPTRLDTTWSPTLGYQGRNNPLNRWRLTKMRDRARDLERNNALAASLLERMVENVIGTGFTFNATTDDEGFNQEVTELWNDWTDTADLRGMHNWLDFQRTLYRSHIRDGDVGVALIKKGDDCFLQMAEGDLIDTQYGANVDPQMIDGIMWSDENRPLSFQLVTVGPDARREAQTISARDFVFYPRLKSYSQYRGEPCFAPVFDLFDQLDGYKEAVIVAARVAACQALLIRKATGVAGLGAMPVQQNVNGQNQRLQAIEPGMVHYLNPGEEVIPFNPSQPTTVFDAFVAAQVRFIGICVGMPLEVLLLDFSRTNYSSARAALLQLQRACIPQQRQFASVLSRIYRWRVSRWVKTGQLRVPAKIAGSFWNHHWTPAGWAWVDPQKDLVAAAMEIDLGLNSRTSIAASHGRNLEHVRKTLAAERAEAEALGLPDVRSTQTREPDMGGGLGAGDSKTVQDKDNDNE